MIETDWTAIAVLVSIAVVSPKWFRKVILLCSAKWLSDLRNLE